MLKKLMAVIPGLLLAACTGTDKQAPQSPGNPVQKTAPAKKIIALQPLHGFPAGWLTAVQRQAAAFYNADVQVLPEKTVPAAFITRVKTTRYRADSILAWLKAAKLPQVQYVAGLTTKDISTTKYDDAGRPMQPQSRYADWGVFGLGYMPGAACVISSHRLRTGAPALVQERIVKVVLHELGHNMGLPHCPNPCFMKDAVEKLSTVDQEPMQLCDSCRKKLHL